MPVAKTLDPVFGGEARLPFANLGDPEVVETEVRGQMRLVMAGEERPRPDDIRPFGEPLPPPFVVLGDGVELGQVEGQGPGPRRLGPG